MSIPWPMRTFSHPPRRQEALGGAEVVGVGDLQVARLAGHDPHGAAERLHEHGVVGGSGRRPCAWARRRTPARKACGVWTATSVLRSSVLVTVPAPSTALMVSLAGTPGTAPSAPSSVTAVDHGVEEGRARPAVAPHRARRSPRRRRGRRPARSAPSRLGWRHRRRRRRRRGGPRRPGPAGSTRTTPADEGRHASTAHSSTRAAAERGELLRSAETASRSRRPRRSTTPAPRCDRAGDQVSASFRRSSAVSSSTLRAKVSSDTRIWRARCSMRFSPADSPLSLSRMERFRTTSATW